jgi:hypothetical protein
MATATAVKGESGTATLFCGADEYTVERVPPGLDQWCVQVSRPGHVHRVALDHDGAWRCDCESYRYSKAIRGKSCKHLRSVRALWELMAAIKPERQT